MHEAVQQPVLFTGGVVFKIFAHLDVSAFPFRLDIVSHLADATRVSKTRVWVAIRSKVLGTLRDMPSTIK